jgi:hypothetical protein
MEDLKSNKEIIEDFEKKLSNCPLLNIDYKLGTLELLTPEIHTFFDELVTGSDFSFTTMFDSTFSSEDGKIDFNGKRILRKTIYTKGELNGFYNQSVLNPDKLSTCELPLQQDLALSALADTNYVFLSFGNLYYQEKGKKSVSISPLVFFRVKIWKDRDTYKLALTDNSPIFNKVLTHIIERDYQVGMNFDTSGFDFKSILDEAKSKTEKLSFGVDDSINLLSCDVFYWMRMADVVNYYPHMSSDLIFRSINEEMNNLKKVAYASKNDHPSFVSDGLNALATYSLVSVDNMDPLSINFIKETIDEYILHKNTILLLSSTKEKTNQLRKTLNEDYYDAFLPYRSLTQPGTAIFTMMESLEKNPKYVFDDAIEVNKEKLFQLDEKHRELDRKIKSINLPTDETAKEVFLNYSKAINQAKEIYDFSSFDSYEYTDFLADNDFLSFVDSFNDFKSSPFTQHPFYGLNSTVKEDQYKNIKELLQTLVLDINEFEKAINLAEVKSSGWSDFNSLRDFDESVKMFSIYSKYEGFPTNWFNIDFNSELKEQINDLEEAYRLEASIKLSIDVLCQPEIWGFDFKETLKDTEDRHKEKELRKKLKGIIKITPFKKSYKTLIVFIDKLNENSEKIATLRPLVENVFNEYADNLDGLLAIDKAYEFIKSYERHKKLYDHLNFDNPFTNKIFSDSSFSEKYKSEYYPALMEKRVILEHDFDRFRTPFDEDKYDYFKSSFQEIKERLMRRMNASEESFLTYLTFSIKADASSKQMQHALDLVEDKNENLMTFRFDFMASLYQYLMLKAMNEREGTNLLEDNSANVFDFYRLGKDSGNLLRIDTIKAFSSLRLLLLTRPSYGQALTLLKHKYHTSRLFAADAAIKMAGDVFFHLYPIVNEYINEATYLNDYKFDLVIVDLRDDSSLLDLYSALMMGKKVIVIGSQYLRSSKAHNLSLSLDNDLKRYTHLNKYPASFYDKVKRAFSRQDIEIIENKKVGNITVPFYFEKDGEQFALRLEDGEDELRFGDSYVLPLLLLSLYGIKTVYLYPLPFIVYPDLEVMCCYKDVKQLISQMNKTHVDLNKMTYEQRKKAEYFIVLDEVASGFPKYQKASEEIPSLETCPMQSSSKEERPITNISYFEIANGILAFLSRFTFLSRDTLIKRLAAVVGTDEKDVDFRLLFQKAENYLLSEKLIQSEKGRLALVRE